MTYLHMELTHKRDVQKKFIEYSAKIIKQYPQIEDLIELGKQAGYTGLAGHALNWDTAGFKNI